MICTRNQSISLIKRLFFKFRKHLKRGKNWELETASAEVRGTGISYAEHGSLLPSPEKIRFHSSEVKNKKEVASSYRQHRNAQQRSAERAAERAEQSTAPDGTAYECCTVLWALESGVIATCDFNLVVTVITTIADSYIFSVVH